jgi:predicted methyltransferase
MASRLLPQIAGIALLALVAPVLATQAAPARQAAFKHRAQLAKAVADTRRTPENRARDRFRHPLETLSFFGVKPNDTVVEIWPSRGWYTEILAPYLSAGGGRLLLATPNGQLGPIADLQKAHPAIYANVTAAVFPAFDAASPRIPDGSADVVLTFRNVHNWRMGAGRDDKRDYSADAFRQMYAMLKPGGTLGVVDHRLPESADAERERTSGYVKVSTVRRLAQQAGFRLAGSSEINANRKDTTVWPAGVWTLPPSLRLGDTDRAKYVAVGESDRMTLKFVKPR